MSSDPYIEQSDKPDFDLSELLDLQAKVICGRMSVGMVAQVQSWDRATQTCSVQPVAQAQYTNGDPLILPVIPRVPIRYPQGGGFVMTWPLERGDFVWLDFGERSIEEWKGTASASYSPKNKRRFDLSDAVAYPGIASPADPIADSVIKDNAMVLGHEAGCRIEIYETETKIGAGATDFAALAALVKSELASLWTALNGHTHATTAVVGGGGAVGVISSPVGQPLGSAGDVKASKTKVE